MPEELASTTDYGMLDRLMHRIAFVHPRLQRALSELENDLFRKQLAGVRVDRPVFVTGLPRAGTTLMLELLYGTGGFATFTYRQMPFVLSPLLWNRISAGSQKAATLRQRAHGDEMLVGFDSPEAFEEVLWINYLASELFEEEGAMRTLAAVDLTDEFRTAYRRLAQKIVCLSGGGSDSPSSLPRRYLSKNNANIARLPAIASVFDDATLLCCFRHPVSHAASLLRQHLRFNALHDDDAFAERYMGWIGHHDFGRNFRPIRFAEPIRESPLEQEFWLRYWIDGYRQALDRAPEQVRFVRFESLLEDGAGMLSRLADVLDIAEPRRLIEAATSLRAPTTTPSMSALSPSILQEAEDLHGELCRRAV